MRQNRRPSWVWAALSLQFVVASLSVYGCIQLIGLLFRQPAFGLQFFVREFIFAATAVAALVGMWHHRKWGWALALVTDGAMCILTLWFFLNYSYYLGRHPAFVAHSIWQFAALVALLYGPVREYFFRGSPNVGSVAQTSLQRPYSKASEPWRVIGYYAAAVLSTCIGTAFSLAVFMGPKNGGNIGFLIYLWFGLVTGSLASFLFAVILTFFARKLDPTRLWLWLLLGGSLAPAMIFVFAFAGTLFLLILGPGPWGTVFWGPQTLLQVWWLTLPVGVVTGWICYLMYPWRMSTVRG